ncbi:MAG: hypothetical protein ACNFW9_04030 [Candidatus Kerfeldbacteria bacterium]
MFQHFKKKIIYIAFIFAIAIIGFGIAPSAQAITLIPPTLELGLTPGQAVNTVIKLFNETSETIELYTEARSFTAKDDTGQPDFDFNTESIGLSTWMNVEEGPIVIESGERYEVSVIINPPINADPGGHYAALFFTSAAPEEGQVKVASKIGTLILASVEGDVNEQGSISEFIVEDGQKMFNRLPVGFVSRFNNTGNVHLKPVGNVEINNLFGKTTDTLDFNASKGATLPKSTRKYDIVWEKGNVDNVSGNFWSDFWQEFGNEKDNFAFGKYTATLSITAGTSQIVSDTGTVTFWVMPWRLLLVWFIVIVFGILLLIFLFKKYNAWIIKKAKK